MPIPQPNFEPYRVTSVEPIALTTAEQRRQYLEDAQYNLFRIPAERVMIDLLTDSGTGAMSGRQWAGMMRGDESYAGSSSYQRLVETCRHVFGISNVLPTHQGRVSERLLVEAVIGRANDCAAGGHSKGAGAPAGRGRIVPNNAHFDSTRAMIEASGAQAVNLLCPGGDDPELDAPFKGNMDVQKLEQLLQERGDDVPFVMLTVTCNSNGGQPVSLENLRQVRELCDRFDKPLFLDACRFAENAWFIQQREPGMRGQSVAAIAREMFDLCDGVSMSARKDALSNVGGLLLIPDERLFRKACDLCIVTQGFSMTYGSLPGRDLEAIAIGLHEAMDETYLSHRAAMVARLAAQLEAGGVSIVRPAGGHAVFIDARRFCPALGEADRPGHLLTCALYEHAGIRAACVGSVLKPATSAVRAGRVEPKSGESWYPLVRLAIPRRTYTQAHLDYVAQAVIALKQVLSEPDALPAQPRPMSISATAAVDDDDAIELRPILAAG